MPTGFLSYECWQQPVVLLRFHLCQVRELANCEIYKDKDVHMYLLCVVCLTAEFTSECYGVFPDIHEQNVEFYWMWVTHVWFLNLVLNYNPGFTIFHPTKIDHSCLDFTWPRLTLFIVYCLVLHLTPSVLFIGCWLNLHK